MQAAEMLCNTMGYHLVFLISLAIGHVHSAPLQTLPSIAGYIPVYIRYGDQPLEDINPQLAEAFHEIPAAKQATVLPNVNGPTDSSLMEEASKIGIHAKRVRKAENDFSPIVKFDASMNKDDSDEELKKLVNQLQSRTEEKEDTLKQIQADLKEQLKLLEVHKGCATDHSQAFTPSTNEDYDTNERVPYNKENALQQRVKDGIRIGENIFSSIFGGKKNIRNQLSIQKVEVPQEILDGLDT
ncbi:uncharacterized protein LOC144471087 [Augochlora pura]